MTAQADDEWEEDYGWDGGYHVEYYGDDDCYYNPYYYPYYGADDWDDDWDG